MHLQHHQRSQPNLSSDPRNTCLRHRRSLSLHHQQQQNRQKKNKPNYPINHPQQQPILSFIYSSNKKQKRRKKMSQTQKPTKAFKLTAASGTLVLINGALLAVVTEWFPKVMPTLPGSTSNDPSMLFSLSAVGLTLGALILLSALMLHLKPANRRIWGTASMAFSVPTVIMGGGFFAGCIMGIYGGVSAIRFKPKNPSAKTKTLFSSLLSKKDGMRIEGAGPKILAPMF